MSEVNAWYSVTRLDPTSDLSLMEFLCGFPTIGITGMEKRPLFKRAFQAVCPARYVRGEEGEAGRGSWLSHCFRERAIFEDTLQSLETMPEVREILDLPLMRRCLAELVAKVDPRNHGTPARASILFRGIVIGLHSSPYCRLGAAKVLSE